MNQELTEENLIKMREAAFYAATSSAVAGDSIKQRRKAISDYLKALRAAGSQYRARLHYDMMTIKHGFGILKTPYGKLFARRMKYCG